RDREAKRVRVRLPAVAGGEVSRQEGVARADRRDRLEPLGVNLVEPPLVVPPDERVATLLVGDDRLARSQLADLVEPEGVVRPVAELVTGQLLRLALVGRHEVGPGPHREIHRSTLGVDLSRDALALALP